MEQLTPISIANPPDAKPDPPPWNRIFKFALFAWILGMLSLALTAAGFMSG